MDSSESTLLSLSAGATLASTERGGHGMQRPISFYLPLILTAVGGLTYHLVQKPMPTVVSLVVLLAATFATALTLSLLSLLVTELASLRLRQSVNWSSLAVGAEV